jgi:hypothetical protein
MSWVGLASEDQIFTYSHKSEKLGGVDFFL